MTTNWSQEKFDCLTRVELGEAEQELRVHPQSLIPRRNPQIDHPLPNRVEVESLPAAGYTQWKMWIIGWDEMLVALVGVMILLFLCWTFSAR